MNEAYVFLERFGKPGGGKGILVSDGLCPTLTGSVLYVCTDMKENEMKLEIYENNPSDSRINGPYEICPTLTYRMGTGGGNTPYTREKGSIGEYIVRRITPLECERLQGFPDGYTDIPWPNAEHVPDSHRYKALGNSMAVPVMKWIGERIEYALSHSITEDKSDKIPYQLELF